MEIFGKRNKKCTKFFINKNLKRREEKFTENFQENQRKNQQRKTKKNNGNFLVIFSL